LLEPGTGLVISGKSNKNAFWEREGLYNNAPCDSF